MYFFVQFKTEIMIFSNEEPITDATEISSYPWKRRAIIYMALINSGA